MMQLSPKLLFRLRRFADLRACCDHRSCSELCNGHQTLNFRGRHCLTFEDAKLIKAIKLHTQDLRCCCSLAAPLGVARSMEAITLHTQDLRFFCAATALFCSALLLCCCASRSLSPRRICDSAAALLLFCFGAPEHHATLTNT